MRNRENGRVRGRGGKGGNGRRGEERRSGGK